MKHVHVALVALGLAVLVGGLAGCRSRAKQPAAAQPGPMVQAPTPTYITPDSSMAQVPSTTYTQPYDSSAQPGTVVSSRVISRGPRPAEGDLIGSPDGMPSGDYPEAFPNAAMAAPGSSTGSVTSITAAADTSAALDVEIDRLRDELVELRGEIAKADAPPAVAPSTGLDGSSVASRFADELRARTRGEVIVNGNTVVVRVTDAFESGSNQLKKDAGLIGTLQATANALATTPAASVEVVGHSDSTPLKRTKDKWGTNKRLSEARAQTVATELSRHGVPASRMMVSGMGSDQPLDARNTKSAHAKNRRVEVVIRF